MEERKKKALNKISIHALREEGDLNVMPEFRADAVFLSTPSARRATDENYRRGLDTILFLSTPSARRATTQLSKLVGLLSHFYPRPPRGGRLCRLPAIPHRQLISIHALREEGDKTRGAI